jgi:hypothetical protein
MLDVYFDQLCSGTQCASFPLSRYLVKILGFEHCQIQQINTFTFAGNFA